MPQRTDFGQHQQVAPEWLSTNLLLLARILFEGFYPQLFEFSVKMRAFYAHLLGDARDVAVLLLHLIIEIEAVEMFARFAQRQI